MRVSRLLLIEDDADHAALIRAYCQVLPGGAIQVDVRETLRAGVDALGSERYGAVLLDLHLPDASGLELLNPVVLAARETPVVVLTTLDDRELAEMALARGAQDYLLKQSLTADALERALRHAVQRKAFECDLARYDQPMGSQSAKLLQLASATARSLVAPLAMLREYVMASGQGNAAPSPAFEAARAAERRLSTGIDQLEAIFTRSVMQPSPAPTVELEALCADLARGLGAGHSIVSYAPLPSVVADEASLRRLVGQIAETLLGTGTSAERKLRVAFEARRDPGGVLVFECVDRRRPTTAGELELVTALAESSADVLGGSLWPEGDRLVLFLPGMAIGRVS